MDYQGYGTQPTYIDEMMRMRNALAEKDREIAQWKNTIRDEYVGFLAESKENLLQQYVNLTQMYGEQKHEIRRLLATIAEKDRAYHALMGQAIKMAECITFEFPPDITEVTSANSFLSSPEVREWREKEGKK